MKDAQYKVDLTIRCLITVDEDHWTLEDAVNDLAYVVAPHPDEEHIDVVETEMTGMEVVGSRTDTIKL